MPMCCADTPTRVAVAHDLVGHVGVVGSHIGTGTHVVPLDHHRAVEVRWILGATNHHPGVVFARALFDQFEGAVGGEFAVGLVARGRARHRVLALGVPGLGQIGKLACSKQRKAVAAGQLVAEGACRAVGSLRGFCGARLIATGRCGRCAGGVFWSGVVATRVATSATCAHHDHCKHPDPDPHAPHWLPLLADVPRHDSARPWVAGVRLTFAATVTPRAAVAPTVRSGMADPAPQAPAAPSRLRWVRAAVTVCVVALAVLLLAPMLGSSDHPVGPGSVSIGFWPCARPHHSGPSAAGTGERPHPPGSGGGAHGAAFP